MTTIPTTSARWSRRAVLAAAAALLAACAQAPLREPPPPVVFVHGNGDTAALWSTTVWRFESNGWTGDRLHAIDLPYPLARDTDDKAQPGRTPGRCARWRASSTASVSLAEIGRPRRAMS